MLYTELVSAEEIHKLETDGPAMDQLMDLNERNYYLMIRFMMLHSLQIIADRNQQNYLKMAVTIFSDRVRVEERIEP